MCAEHHLSPRNHTHKTTPTASYISYHYTLLLVLHIIFVHRPTCYHMAHPICIGPHTTDIRNLQVKPVAKSEPRSIDIDQTLECTRMARKKLYDACWLTS